MGTQLDSAHDAVERASDATDDATVREQLQSIDDWLLEMIEDEDPEDAEDEVPHGDNLEEVEEKLSGLVDETDGAAQRYIQDARDAIDEYRRTYTREW